MNSYIFAWNPKNWIWEDLPECVVEANQTGRYLAKWSCANVKKIRKGDRAFLVKLGEQPKGIIGSGFVVSDVYEANHWNTEQAITGKKTNRVNIEFDVLSETPIVCDNELRQDVFKRQIWYTQKSGISIDKSIAIELEKLWQSKTKGLTQEEIISASKCYLEGKSVLRNVYSYERNNEARAICLEKYGYKCYICDFSFEQFYGKLGKNFIHVHHIKPISEIGGEYKINPIKDLVPVCPNCHAMLHRKVPAIDVNGLKNIINKNEKK